MPPPHLTQDQADEYAIGALDPDVARLVTIHIDDCGACRALVREAERVAATLALGIQRHAPPPKLKGRVFRSAGIVRPGPVAVALRVATAGAGIAAVAVAIAAFVGFLSLRGDVDDLRDENSELQTQVDSALSQRVELAVISQRLEEEERLTEELQNAAGQDRDLLIALLSPESLVAEVVSVNENDPDAIGRLVWDKDQGRVWFVASRLEQLAPGTTYQLWVYSDGRYSSLGTFAADAAGFARYVNVVPQGLDGYESAVVTIERAPGAFEREGPSVFVTDLSRIQDE